MPEIFLGLLIFLGIPVLLLAMRASEQRPDRPRTPPAAHPSPPRPALRQDLPRGAMVPVQTRLPKEQVIRGRAWVIDGDTIMIGATNIRLAGVDAPELDGPYGQKSKWEMVALCKGQEIRAELTGERSYDRVVATCFLPDGRDLGGELIRRGQALDGGYFSRGKYRHLEPKGIRWKLRHEPTSESTAREADGHALPIAPPGASLRPKRSSA